MTRAYNTATTQQNSGGAVPAFLAGKNKIINGDFGIWQRGTSFTPSVEVYTADRWLYGSDLGSGAIISQQTFSPGTAPIAGYEGTYFLRYARTSGTTTYNFIRQPIEDVRIFAGQTVTLSFWAKADAATTITPSGAQIFGTSGSSPVDISITPSASLTTSWQRFTWTFAVPSISGKTIGTNSNLRMQINYGTGNKVVDIWGVQVEAGSIATPFQTATGTLQGELAACQRYFQKSFQLSTAPANNSNDPLGPITFGRQATSGAVEPQMWIQWKTQMRSAPSVTLYNLYSGTAGQWSDGSTTGANARCFNISDTAAVIDNTDVTLTLANAVIHYAASSEL